MFNLIHNKVNSNYFIINIKLHFPNSNNLNIYNECIDLKKKYLIIIKKWIMNILDRYSIMSNWILYITNLNFNTVRIFIYLNSLNYNNMDDKNLIYLSDMKNYETLFKINILEFSKLFHIEKLNLLIDLEFNLIKPNLEELSDDSDSLDSLDSLDDSNDSDSSNNVDDLNNLDDSVNIQVNNNVKQLNSFDIIDFNYFTKNQLSKSQLVKQYNELCINERYNIITDIGISGLNKVTFFNELKKLNYIHNSNIYSNKYFNIYNYNLYTKIKENNKCYWNKQHSHDLTNHALNLIFHYNSQ